MPTGTTTIRVRSFTSLREYSGASSTSALPILSATPCASEMMSTILRLLFRRYCDIPLTMSKMSVPTAERSEIIAAPIAA